MGWHLIKITPEIVYRRNLVKWNGIKALRERTARASGLAWFPGRPAATQKRLVTVGFSTVVPYLPMYIVSVYWYDPCPRNELCSQLRVKKKGEERVVNTGLKPSLPWEVILRWKESQSWGMGWIQPSEFPLCLFLYSWPQNTIWTHNSRWYRRPSGHYTLKLLHDLKVKEDCDHHF